jgi:nicotinamide riboside transporter PnuC
MADIDRQKEVVNTIRVVWLFLIGTLFGLFAFLFQNFDKLSDFRLILINVVIVINVFVVIYLSKKLKENIDKLKEL